MQTALITYLLPIALFLVACSVQDSDIAGATDIETGGTIAGIIHTPEGKPVAFAKISLIPDGYNPVTKSNASNRHDVYTDTQGYYTIDSIEDGDYSLETVDGEQTHGLYKQDISIVHSSEYSYSDTLQPMGRVIISFPLQSNISAGTLYLKNTTFITEIDSNSTQITATFTALPAGQYTPVLYINQETSTPLNGLETFTLPVGDTLFIEPEYESSSELEQNTSSASVFISSSSSNNGSSSIALLSSSISLSSSSVETLSSSISLSSSLVGASSSALLNDTTEILHLNGDPEHIEIQGGIDYDWTNYGLSMELWVKLDTIENHTHLFNLAGGSNNNYFVAFDLQVDSLGEHYLEYVVSNSSDGSGDWYGMSIHDIFTIDEWIHVAVTVTSEGYVTFYVNGKVHTQETEPNLKALPRNVARSSNFIGKSSNSDGAYLNGLVDNVRLWNRALNASEIEMNLYSTNDQLYDATSLVFSYDFNYFDTQPSTVTDATGNHHGSINSIDADGSYGEQGTWRPQVDFRSELGF
ncbi:MAG: hypothetical protein OCD01_04515 [Fibrobacterales bacterium]